MRIILVFILSSALLFLGYEAYSFYVDKNIKNEKLFKLTAELGTIEEENKTTKEKLEYFSHEENLEKELRSKFNYKYPDEKMIIIVPK